MKFDLVRFDPEFSNSAEVMVVIEDVVGHLVVDSPDRLDSVQHEIVRTDTVEFLSLTLEKCKTASRKSVFRMHNSGADDDQSVEIWLMEKADSGCYDIVRRHGSADVVLNEDALSIGYAINILAECSAVKWRCDLNSARDVETVCVSNAMAIMSSLEV